MVHCKLNCLNLIRFCCVAAPICIERLPRRTASTPARLLKWRWQNSSAKYTARRQAAAQKKEKKIKIAIASWKGIWIQWSSLATYLFSKYAVIGAFDNFGIFVHIQSRIHLNSCWLAIIKIAIIRFWLTFRTLSLRTIRSLIKKWMFNSIHHAKFKAVNSNWTNWCSCIPFDILDPEVDTIECCIHSKRMPCTGTCVLEMRQMLRCDRPYTQTVP